MRWHHLQRHVRLRPAWPWWAVWVGGATAVAGLLDVTGLAPWWVGPPAGLLLAIGVLGLTTLDDVRRPMASLRVLAAELRSPPPVEPGRASAVRARAFDIPLYAPPPDAADDIGLTGRGASYGPRLLSPARQRLRVSWSDPASDRAKDVWATTAVDPDDHRAHAWLYDGQVRSRPVDDRLEDPGELRIDEEAVFQQDASLTVVLDGVAHQARAADLRPWGAGWAATLQLDDRHRLDLCGRGRLPDRIELVRWEPAALAHR